MNTKWMNDPVFKKMHPAKQQVIYDIMKMDSKKKNQQRGMEDIMMDVMNANSKLTKAGQSFTDEERTTMLRIILSELPENQRTQAELLINMMNQNRK